MTRRALKVYNALDLRYTPTEGTDAARKVDVDIKADKVNDATEGNLAALDSSGNLTDAGTSAGAITTALDNHVNATTVHGSTATPTAERIAEYNSAGNLQSGTPTEDSEVTTRGFIAEFLRTTTLSIKASPGTVVSIKIGSYSATIAADDDGFVNIETQHQGDAEIYATYKGVKVGRTAEFIVYNYNKYEIDLEVPATFALYGVRHYVGESSPALTRLADSADYTFAPETSTEFGGSTFDDKPIYKDIKTCVVDYVNGALSVIYEDEASFTRTPATGDVCVEIPLFYYWRDGSHLNDATPYEDLYISDLKLNENFQPSPAHQDRGDGAGVRDRVFVGAYTSDASGRSISGVTPATSVSLSSARSTESARGSAYHVLDLATLYALQILYDVQVGTLDSQSAVGNGITGASAISANGTTDSLVYASGSATGVRYLGIENLWGNVAQLLEGLIWSGGSYYVTADPSKYGDKTKMAALSYSPFSATSFRQIDGFDSSLPWAKLPVGAQSGGSTTYYCDRLAITTSNDRAATVGGFYSQSNAYVGLYAISLAVLAESGTNSNSGYRLQILP